MNVSKCTWMIAGGAILGVLTGWASGDVLHASAHHTAEIFKNLLELVSLPVIFLSIVSTLTGMEDASIVKKLGRRVLTYTIFTTLCAATVGLVLFLLLDPARGAQVLTTGAASGAGALAGTGGKNYIDFLLAIVPSNIFQAFSSNGNVTSIVFLALLFGFSVLGLEKKQKDLLHGGFDALFQAMLGITQFVLRLMPIGVWAFVTLFVRSLLDKTESLSTIGLYLATVVGANIIQGLIILPALLWYKGLSPQKLFYAMQGALTVAFFSKSSNTALPVTLKSVKKAGVSERIANFTIPLCATVNMNGCAAFILITVLFVGTRYGIAFSLIDMISWIFIATIAAVGNAGVPMGCFFLTSAFLASMNVPLQLMGVILPLYALIDMLETALNVWSDSCVAVLVDGDLKK